MSTPEEQISGTLHYITDTYGRDLVINAPCAAAEAVAPVYSGEIPDEEIEETGDGVD